MDWRSVVGFGDVGVVSGVALLAVSNYFDSLVPSSLLQLQHNNNRQRNSSTNFSLRWNLRAFFDSPLTSTQTCRFYKQRNPSCNVST